MKPKKFTRNYLILFILLIGLTTGIYMWQIEPCWIEWKKLELPIRNLPEPLAAATFVQVSDIHIGDRVDKNYIYQAFKEINNLQPDIIAYTGDFIRLVNNEVPWDDLEGILKNAPKGKIATIAILGNHDYGIDFRDSAVASEISERLQKQGITVLRNEHINIMGLEIIGIDDLWGTNFAPQLALQYYKKDAPTLVLCHNPDVADLDVWNGYEGWIIAGHTHAGQVRIPGFGSPILPVKNKRYDQGKINLDNNRTLYINRGLGHSIKVRFNARPEVTIFSLVKK